MRVEASEVTDENACSNSPLVSTMYILLQVRMIWKTMARSTMNWFLANSEFEFLEVEPLSAVQDHFLQNLIIVLPELVEGDFSPLKCDAGHRFELRLP